MLSGKKELWVLEMPCYLIMLSPHLELGNLPVPASYSPPPLLSGYIIMENVEALNVKSCQEPSASIMLCLSFPRAIELLCAPRGPNWPLCALT